MTSLPEVRIRSFEESDRAFFRAIMPRFMPGQTIPARNLADIARFLDQRATGEAAYPADTEFFVAVDAADRPVGLSAIRADEDYFSGRPRAYIELIAVTEVAQGTGVGRTLMDHAEAWARARQLDEIALDVFASNTGAIAFYQRAGFQSDFIRMSKSLRLGAASTDNLENAGPNPTAS